MKFFPLDPVVLKKTRVSRAGGKKRTFDEDSKGRVCKVHAGGSCCVQFGTRCLRVHEDFLEVADEPAPECTPTCTNSC